MVDDDTKSRMKIGWMASGLVFFFAACGAHRFLWFAVGYWVGRAASSAKKNTQTRDHVVGVYSIHAFHIGTL